MPKHRYIVRSGQQTIKPRHRKMRLRWANTRKRITHLLKSQQMKTPSERTANYNE